MASSGDKWFGRFKIELANEFGNDAVQKMSMYFSVNTVKVEQINDAKNSGLELLTIMEDMDIIGEKKGIDNLCTALRHCSLNKIAQTAEELYNGRKLSPRNDYPDGPSGVKIDLDKLEFTLEKELTKQHCFELAVFFGLRAQVVEEVKASKHSAKFLILQLQDAGMISDSNVNAMLFALRKLELIRVANLIQDPEALKLPANKTKSNTDVKLPYCICGKYTFDELQSESDASSLVSIRCTECSAEWFPNTTSSGNLSLSWKDINYSYKSPITLDLSKLEHEDISTISQLQPGDHIIFDRHGFYHHHAIFIDNVDGKLDVIHWSTASVMDKLFTNKKNVGIQRGKETFPFNGVKRVNYNKQDDSKVVIARAFKMLSGSEKGYNIVDNNCESLASYCKIGKSITTQGKLLDDNLPRYMVTFARAFGRS